MLEPVNVCVKGACVGAYPCVCGRGHVLGLVNVCRGLECVCGGHGLVSVYVCVCWGGHVLRPVNVCVAGMCWDLSCACVCVCVWRGVVVVVITLIPSGLCMPLQPPGVPSPR